MVVFLVQSIAMMSRLLCLWVFHVLLSSVSMWHMLQKNNNKSCVALCNIVYLSQKTTWYMFAFWCEAGLNRIVLWTVLAEILHGFTSFCLLSLFPAPSNTFPAKSGYLVSNVRTPTVSLSISSKRANIYYKCQMSKIVRTSLKWTTVATRLPQGDSWSAQILSHRIHICYIW